MSEAHARRSVTVQNAQGLHARPAYMLAELAGKYESKVELVKDGERVDGKSILSILTLGAKQGTELVLEAVGSDAEAALDALAELEFLGTEENQVTEENT